MNQIHNEYLHTEKLFIMYQYIIIKLKNLNKHEFSLTKSNIKNL